MAPPNTGRANPYGPSLDRINPSDGYTPENTRVVVWALNAMRNEFSDEVIDFVFASWKEERVCQELCL